jgi:hypothetical protein
MSQRRRILGSFSYGWPFWPHCPKMGSEKLGDSYYVSREDAGAIGIAGRSVTLTCCQWVLEKGHGVALLLTCKLLLSQFIVSTQYKDEDV